MSGGPKADGRGPKEDRRPKAKDFGCGGCSCTSRGAAGASPRGMGERSGCLQGRARGGQRACGIVRLTAVRQRSGQRAARCEIVNSQSTRSEKGLENHSAIRSLFETAKRQGKKPHRFFLDLFTKNTAGAQA